jgi:hypothetical protein
MLSGTLHMAAKVIPPQWQHLSSGPSHRSQWQLLPKMHSALLRLHLMYRMVFDSLQNLLLALARTTHADIQHIRPFPTSSTALGLIGATIARPL